MSRLRAIGFLRPANEGDPDYLRRIARLRWRRRFPGRRAVELDPDARAADVLGGEEWIVVRDETALPLPGGDVAAGGGVRVFAGVAPSALPVVHTLAELEGASVPPDLSRLEAPAPALAFDASERPPVGAETVASYVDRLLASAPRRALASAVVFDEEWGERPEVTRHVPPGVRFLLDVGCGTGRVGAALARARPGLEVTGIERRADFAAQARERLTRVIERDAADALRELSSQGDRFDAFLFADVLEHLEDPIGALGLARAVASPEAILVASVPNVGHLSIVRDLVRGRFDPLPAGLCDAGHLRWFTRGSLEDALDEAGWDPVAVESVAGAAPCGAGGFVERARAFPEADAESLATYQWIAVARVSRRAGV